MIKMVGVSEDTHKMLKEMSFKQERSIISILDQMVKLEYMIHQTEIRIPAHAFSKEEVELFNKMPNAVLVSSNLNEVNNKES